MIPKMYSALIKSPLKCTKQKIRFGKCFVNLLLL